MLLWLNICLFSLDKVLVFSIFLALSVFIFPFHRMQNRFRHSSFTLIEMLVVVVIIGILAGVLVPRMVGAKERANDSARMVKVWQLTTAVELYAQENGGTYPIATLTTTGTSVAMVADKISSYVSTIPTDPGKGTIAILGVPGNIQVTGDSFAYYTNTGWTMFAITALMESKKGNTTNATGVVDSDKKGWFQVAGKWLTYNILAEGSNYAPEGAWTDATCFTFSAGTITDYSLSCTKNVVIPEKINGISITTIGWSAFASKSLTSLTIPNSVTTIETSAFQQNNLTSITFPTSLTSIGVSAFASNNLTTLIISPSVTSIGANAFNTNWPNKNSYNLTSFVPGTSQTWILSSPYWVKQLSGDACFTFSGSELIAYWSTTYTTCPKVAVIPETYSWITITRIGNGVFHEKYMTSVTIPSTVTSFGDNAFSSTSFTSLSTPSGLTDIGKYAFYYANIRNFVIPASMTTIKEWVFAYSNLTTVTIPNTITSIWRVAFGGANLTSVTIPNTITTLEEWVFMDNYLTSITIPNTVTTIWNAAFFQNKLTTVTLPSSVTSVAANAFSYNWASRNSAGITNFVPNTLQTWNLSGSTWVKQ